MRLKRLVGIALFFLLIPCSWAAQPDAKGFALVELFASEGCSNCPAADALLSQIIQKAKNDHLPIYALSFQVDYWNYMGWRDHFSSPLFTERQGQYVFVLKARGSYTPQMVVNGQKEFIGSEESMAWNVINTFMNESTNDTIRLNLEKTVSSKVVVHYQLNRVVEHTALQLALVESGIESHPNAGENDGLTLKHDNIVVELKTIGVAEPKGEASFKLPAGVDLSKFAIIAYVQNLDDLKVLSAGSVEL